jgi:hypothetical protein
VTKKKNVSKLSFVPLGKFRRDISSFLSKSQEGWLVVMRHQSPVALVQGVRGMEIEEVVSMVEGTAKKGETEKEKPEKEKPEKVKKQSKDKKEVE